MPHKTQLQLPKPTREVDSLKNMTFGLPGRRRPFIADGPAEAAFVRDEIGRVIAVIDPMLTLFVTKARNTYPLDELDAEDVMQDVRMRLALYSLPRYDTARRTKGKPATLFTFVYGCAWRIFIDRLISLHRASRRIGKAVYSLDYPDRYDGSAFHESLPSQDAATDRQVERATKQFIDDTQKLRGTDIQTRVRKALVQNPNALYKDIQESLEISTSSMKLHTRIAHGEAIKQLDLLYEGKDNPVYRGPGRPSRKHLPE